MNAHIRNCCTWQRLALTALLMFTGTSQAAGLLTPSDGRFPELEIRDHAVDVVIEDYILDLGRRYQHLHAGDGPAMHRARLLDDLSRIQRRLGGSCRWRENKHTLARGIRRTTSTQCEERKTESCIRCEGSMNAYMRLNKTTNIIIYRAIEAKPPSLCK